MGTRPSASSSATKQPVEPKQTLTVNDYFHTKEGKVLGIRKVIPSQLIPNMHDALLTASYISNQRSDKRMRYATCASFLRNYTSVDDIKVTSTLSIPEQKLKTPFDFREDVKPTDPAYINYYSFLNAENAPDEAEGAGARSAQRPENENMDDFSTSDQVFVMDSVFNSCFMEQANASGDTEVNAHGASMQPGAPLVSLCQKLYQHRVTKPADYGDVCQSLKRLAWCKLGEMFENQESEQTKNKLLKGLKRKAGSPYRSAFFVYLGGRWALKWLCLSINELYTEHAYQKMGMKKF